MNLGSRVYEYKGEGGFHVNMWEGVFMSDDTQGFGALQFNAFFYHRTPKNCIKVVNLGTGVYMWEGGFMLDDTLGFGAH